MTSKRYTAAIEAERHRKSGIRRWRSEVKRFGDEVVPLIPEGLVDAVLGELPEPIQETDFTASLRKVAPVRVGVNPVAELGRRLVAGTGNGGTSLIEANDPGALLLRLQATSPKGRRLPGR